MEKKWTVTAIVTTFQRKSKLVNRAIRSILAQTRPVDEIILVDDNYPDSPFTRDIKAHLDPSVKYLNMDKNRGVAKARNSGIMRAESSLIAFCDDDDEWMPDKIEKLVKFFEETPNLGIAFGTGTVLNDVTHETSYNWQYEIFKSNPKYYDMLCDDYVGSASSPLILRAALYDVRGFLTEKQPAVEDYELWIRISKKYGVRGTKDSVFLKHMDNSAHVSQDPYKTYLGFRNIYHVNKEDYDHYPGAKVRIMWNVSRQAVKARAITGIPYVCSWFGLKIKTSNFKRGK